MRRSIKSTKEVSFSVMQIRSFQPPKLQKIEREVKRKPFSSFQRQSNFDLLPSKLLRIGTRHRKTFLFHTKTSRLRRLLFVSINWNLPICQLDICHGAIFQFVDLGFPDNSDSCRKQMTVLQHNHSHK